MIEKVCPREPTDAMRKAVFESYESFEIDEVWKGMWDAHTPAPTPAAQDELVRDLRGNMDCLTRPITLAAADALTALTAELASERARNAKLQAALTLSIDALHEAEAILGGEYGDHYASLCNKMLDLEAAARAALKDANTTGEAG